MRNAIDIGQVILNIAEEQGKHLTPLKLMKLVYIAHGWMLAMYNKPLLREEIHAWKYGPVIPDLYYATKNYGKSDITGAISNFNDEKLSKEEKLSDEEEQVIKETFEIYGKHTAWELSNMTHKTNSPWEKSKHEGKTIIKDDLIKEYYLELSRKAN